MRKQRKNQVEVRKRVNVLMGQIMAFEWQLYLMVLPGHASLHRWRVVKWRMLERALKYYEKFLRTELTRRGVDPDTVESVYREQPDNGGAVWKKLPDKPLTREVTGRRIRKVKRPSLTATELLGLGQTGDSNFLKDEDAR